MNMGPESGGVAGRLNSADGWHISKLSHHLMLDNLTKSLKFSMKIALQMAAGGEVNLFQI